MPPRRCGLATFSRDLTTALEHFTGEVGSIRVSALNKDNLPYEIPVDLVIHQYDHHSWVDGVKDIKARAHERRDPTVVLLQHEYGLHVCTVNSFTGLDLDICDVIFLDTFLDELTFLQLYGATNLMLLPYLNQQQISSGILADTLGSGRVAVTTKFRYALELIHSNKRCPEGMVVGRHARGILVDPGDPSVEQMAQALDLLVFNRDKRLAMECDAHQRGYQMRWQNTAWALLQHIEFLQDRDHHRCGRGPIFKREKTSPYQRRMTLSPVIDIPAPEKREKNLNREKTF